jgi:hypothetical protein
LERYPIYNNNPGTTLHTVLSSFEENPHDDYLHQLKANPTQQPERQSYNCQ